MTYLLAREPSLSSGDIDRAALVQNGHARSFRELDDRADRFANVARSAGLIPGDRVLLLMPNAPETFELLIGFDAAKIVRSKNAGPFALTIDLFFDDDAYYELARASTLLTPAGVAAAYGVEESTVKGVWWDDRIHAAKVSLVRWSSSSDPFCSDLFGAHLHTPLADGELDGGRS